MKNFKKVALGLLVTVLAFGFSAFKAEVSGKKNVLTYRYVNTGTNYQLKPDAEVIDGCGGTSPHNCIIETNVNKGTNFSYDDLDNFSWQAYDSSAPAEYQGL
ncbi:hypothetical protein D3C87_50200 [compost metagenome]